MALLKILVVTALAPKLAQVRFERMGESLARRLVPYVRAGLVEVIVEHAVTPARLGSLVAWHRPDVVHVSCHSELDNGVRVLALEDRHGRKACLRADALRALLVGPAGWTPRLVALEACRSAEIAEVLVTGSEPLPRVIGMVDDVTPEHGHYFFETLFHVLAGGLPLDDGIAEARRDLDILAPEAVQNPEIVWAEDAERNERFESSAAFVTRGIAANELGERVHVDDALRRSPVFLGRAKELEELDDFLARRGGARVLHVFGEAGVGVTSLLAEAVARAASRGWQGAARVFVFSFEARTRSLGWERLPEFFDRALGFFGEHSARRDGDLSDSLWTQGLRLGRLVRREPALVVLDDVPTLPGGVAGGERSPESFFHPALAAFVREILSGGLCSIVFSSRVDAGAVRLDADVQRRCEVGGLAQVDAAEMLARAGMVDGGAELAELGRHLRGHPLAIEVIARASCSVGAAKRLLRTTEPVGLGEVVRAVATRFRAKEILTSLWAMEVTPEGVVVPSGGAPPRGLQSAVRAGLVDVSGGSRPTPRIRHGAIAAAFEPWAAPGVVERAAIGDVVCAGVPTLGAMAQARRVLEFLIRRGEIERAASLFEEKVARRVSGQFAHGFVGEELMALAGFFERGDGGSVDWCRPKVEVATKDPLQAARLVHRAGVALRGLGAIEVARQVLGRAIEAFVDGSERWAAAEAAVDLALACLWGEPVAQEGAREAARRAIALADGGDAVRALADAHAVLGGVQASRGELDGAAVSFSEMRRLGGGERGVSALLEFSARLASMEAHRGPLKRVLDEAMGVLRKIRLANQERDTPWFVIGLEGVALGRLAALYHSCGVMVPEPRGGHSAWLEGKVAARAAFAQAIAVLGATQQLWLLPMAYRARAEFRKAVGDGEGESMDQGRAAALGGATGERLDSFGSLGYVSDAPPTPV